MTRRRNHLDPHERRHRGVPFLASPASSPRRRRGLVLPLMLMILILLGLLAASFAFEMHADVASTRAVARRMQTRLAAEAGIQRVLLVLRERRLDVNAWYDNEEELHRAVVWQAGGEPSAFGIPDETATGEQPAFRFSIVADDPTDDETQVRYGITNEAAKLNINVAPRGQLQTLIAQVVPPEVPVAELVDALIDWRDEDDTPGENGAEREYYATLTPPYLPKNAPFDTVEELLMVKGFTGQLLYGEDYDRNGLLSVNEDDGDETFPPDDGDGMLNRGLLPYITTRSRDFNTANDNQPRIYLRGDRNEIGKQLAEYFSEDEIEFIYAALDAGGHLPLTSVVGLLKPVIKDYREVKPPFGPDDLPRLIDRLTLTPTPEFPGLIDVNTAPPPVLQCIPDLPEAAVGEIVNRRMMLTSEAKATPAWLLTAQIVDEPTFELILPHITARGLQFTIEAVGFADHVGTFSRLEATVEMRGPVAQFVYFRDLTPLGLGYPIRSEFETEPGGMERVRGSG